MPIIDDNSRDRIADAMEELCEKLEETLAVRDTPPVLNVEAPTINVEAKAPAPVVNVSAPEHKMHPWTMTVHRGSDGLIQTIDITPK